MLIAQVQLNGQAPRKTKGWSFEAIFDFTRCIAGATSDKP